jgi:AraC-like DNA-binding protein
MGTEARGWCDERGVASSGRSRRAARLEYVHEVLAAALGPLEVRTGDGNEPPDQVRAADLGAVRVGELWASRPGGADRRRRHIQATNADLCKVDLVARGEIVLEQDGRQARIHNGDFAFVDLSRPAHWTNRWSTRVVAIAFPRKLLPLQGDDLAGLTGVGLTGDDGPGAVFSSTARQLARQVERLDPAGGTRVGMAALDLLTVALAGRLDRLGEVPPDTSRRALLLRVHAFIEDQLADPRLTPAAVARAHHVSVRSLAARWGLTNAAPFSRAFRAAYGVSPVELRRLGDRTPPG